MFGKAVRVLFETKPLEELRNLLHLGHQFSWCLADPWTTGNRKFTPRNELRRVSGAPRRCRWHGHRGAVEPLPLTSSASDLRPGFTTFPPFLPVAMSGGYGRRHLENKQPMQLVRFRRRVSAAHTITRMLRRGPWLGRRDAELNGAELRGWGTARTRRRTRN